MTSSHIIRIAILTASNRASAGIYEDKSGPALEQLVLQTLPATIIETCIVPDDRGQISRQLREWADSGNIDLILTTGGTGFTPSDITPEATLDIIEKQAPGLCEVMRAQALAITPHAMLSRAVAGIRGHVLIINLPGSPKGATENLQAVLPALPHAIALLREDESKAAAHHFIRAASLRSE